jgi:hypothetical protein
LDAPVEGRENLDIGMEIYAVKIDNFIFFFAREMLTEQ